MIGHQSISAFMYSVGLLPLFFILLWPVPDIVKLMVVASIMFTMLGIGWILYLVSVNSLQPAINKLDPEKWDVWVEFGKNGLFTLKPVEKGAYGRTKGIQQKQKADVINRGKFTVRFRNGNTGLIVYDMLSGSVDPKEAIGWTRIFKKLKVRSGREAYKKAVEAKEVN